MFQPAPGAIFDYSKWGEGYEDFAYDATWCNKMYRAVKRNSDADLLMLVDQDYPELDAGIVTVKLAPPYHSWEDIMQVWRPDVVEGRKLLYLGLDSFITGDLTPMWEVKDALVTSYPGYSGLMHNGAMLYGPEFAGKLWALYREQGLHGHRMHPESGGYVTEMRFLQSNLPGMPGWRYFDNEMPGQVVDYEHGCGANPDNLAAHVRVVYCAGPLKNHVIPEPSALRSHWV